MTFWIDLSDFNVLPCDTNGVLLFHYFVIHSIFYYITLVMYLNSRDVSEERLGALGVVEGAMPHRPAGSPDGQLAAVKQVTRPVAELSSLVSDLWWNMNQSYFIKVVIKEHMQNKKGKQKLGFLLDQMQGRCSQQTGFQRWRWPHLQQVRFRRRQCPAHSEGC